MTALDRMRFLIRPRASRDPAFMAVAEVLAAQIDSLEAVLIQLGLLYSLAHSRAPLHILKQIGALLELPYQASWSKEQYRTLLRARIRARKSHGTYDDVLAVARLLRRPGAVDDANVSILHPEALQVNIPAAGAGAKAIRALLRGAIQETTHLDITTTADSGGGEGQYLTLSVPNLGLGKKLAKSL